MAQRRENVDHHVSAQRDSAGRDHVVDGHEGDARVTAVLGPPSRLLVLGLIANYVIVPAVTVGLLLLFQADPMVSAGFLILAVCPGAPLGPPITAIAKGDVPWAISLMLILAGLSAFLSPALLSVLLTRIAPDSDLRINSLALVRTLLITQMLPLVMGMGIHHACPG